MREGIVNNRHIQRKCAVYALIGERVYMVNKKTDLSVQEKVYYYAGDVIASDRLKQESQYRQHGCVTCYEHSVAVTYMSVRLAKALRLKKMDMESMIKGALLHDYFLYDWREGEVSRRDHGFDHARRALENARRDFSLTDVACDVIEKHMFPLNIRLPKYKESYLVSVADKICATKEVCRFVSQKVGKSVKRPMAYMRGRRMPTFE